MVKGTISRGRLTLAHLLEELEPLLEVLLERGPMLKAYLDSKPRTCGKPGCRCAGGEKHPAWVLRIPEGSRTRSRAIPEAGFRQFQPLAEEYRRFRQAAVRWRQLMRDADEAIRQIESGRLVDPEVELRSMKHGK